MKKNGTDIKERFILLLFAIAVGLALTMGVLCAGAWAVTKYDVNETWYLWILAGAVCIGGIAASLVFTFKTRLKGIAAGAISSGVHAVLAFLICLIVNGGAVSGRLIGICVVSLLLGTVTGIVVRNVR
ncbi:MAG: hypothetical protein IK104_03065 [Clostridia bacterium]|nr:hypothetical protein [Clostridia bacterium]